MKKELEVPVELEMPRGLKLVSIVANTSGFGGITESNEIVLWGDTYRTPTIIAPNLPPLFIKNLYPDLVVELDVRKYKPTINSH